MNVKADILALEKPERLPSDKHPDSRRTVPVTNRDLVMRITSPYQPNAEALERLASSPDFLEALGAGPCNSNEIEVGLILITPSLSTGCWDVTIRTTQVDDDD